MGNHRSLVLHNMASYVSSRHDLENISLGVPIQTVIRIKPNSGYFREDLKVAADRIGIVDVNNRIREEYICKDIFEGDVPLHSIIDQVFPPYLRAVVEGVNVAFVGFGATGAGKTFNVEGEGTNPGIVSYFVQGLYQMLEDKKFKLNAGRTAAVQSQGFTYSIKIRYVEVADEVINDLLVQANSKAQGTLNVIYDEWEGPMVSSASWLPTSSANHLIDMFTLAKRNRTVYANEFGPLHERAASLLTVEVLQVASGGLNESNVQAARAYFLDMPGAEKLQEDAETLRIKEGTSLNRGIMSFAEIVKHMAERSGDYVQYEASQLTALMRDIIGGNCLTMAFICLQHGDTVNSSLTLNYMRHLAKIMNFPVVNDNRMLGLLRKYRVEIMHMINQLALSSPDSVEGYNVKVSDLEKQVIQSNLDKLRFADERSSVIERMKELKEAYNRLVKEKADLQGDLIRSEEERLQVSRALVELQIENSNLQEGHQEGSYDVNSKLLHAENEVLTAQMKEQKALEAINDMQEKLKSAIEDKREMEIEFVALKTNYLNMQRELQEEKTKNENLGIEVINLVNANKVLTGDTQALTRKKGDLSEEQSRLGTQLDRLRKENRELEDALMNARGEIEQLRSELVKHDMNAQRAQLDYENKKNELERVYIEMARKRDGDVKGQLQDADDRVRRLKEKNELGDADFVTMNRQLKASQRKIQELEDHLNEYMKHDSDMTEDNQKLNLMVEEMRNNFRSKLIRAMNEGVRLDDGMTKAAREELIRSYNEKEVEMTERINKEVAHNQHLTKIVRGLRAYARSLKNLAEDWAPLGQPLPEVLTLPPPLLVDDEDQTLASKVQRDELERLRIKNSRLEQELKTVQAQMIASTEQYTRVIQAQKDPNLQRRLVSELEQLKAQPVSTSRPGSGQYDVDVLRKERNQLKEENKRLMQEVRELRNKMNLVPAAAPMSTGMGGLGVTGGGMQGGGMQGGGMQGGGGMHGGGGNSQALQEEVDRLNRKLKDLESLPAGTGNVRLLQQKVAYLEEVLRKLERERSELSVRATMAEEQLKNLHESMNSTIQTYQKKIADLKRALGRGRGADE